MDDGERFDKKIAPSGRSPRCYRVRHPAPSGNRNGLQRPLHHTPSVVFHIRFHSGLRAALLKASIRLCSSVNGDGRLVARVSTVGRCAVPKRPRYNTYATTIKTTHLTKRCRTQGKQHATWKAPLRRGFLFYKKPAKNLLMLRATG